MTNQEAREAIAELMKDREINVPEGCIRRGDGFENRYARAKDLGIVVRALGKRLGIKGELVSKPWQVPYLWFYSRNGGWGVRVWLPEGDDYFVVSM